MHVSLGVHGGALGTVCVVLSYGSPFATTILLVVAIRAEVGRSHLLAL